MVHLYLPIDFYVFPADIFYVALLPKLIKLTLK